MSDFLLYAASAVAIACAVAVVLARDVMRLALALGGVFLSVAALFSLWGAGFLAIVELFLYVGGVLILVLFAIMLLHRGAGGEPVVETRHDLLAAVASLGIGVLIVFLFRPAVGALDIAPVPTSALAATLLDSHLVAFEAAGALLLAALAAVVSIWGGERE